MKIIGIDIGSTGIKCAIIEDGKIMDKKIVPTPEKLGGHGGGRFELDPYRITSIVKTLIDDMLKENATPQAIWIDTQMHGSVLCDATGKAVSDYISWQDRFGEPYLDEIHEMIGEDVSDLGTRYKAGLSLVSLYARRDLLSDECRYVYTLGSFVLRQIADEGTFTFATHPTMSASLGFYSVSRGAWDMDRIGRVFGDKKLELPSIVPEGTKLASYKGIPVFGDVGDHQAGILGTEGEQEKAVFITLGTGGIVSRPVSDMVFGDFETRPYFDGGYILTKTGQMGGRDLAVIVGLFEGIIKAFGDGSVPEDLWDKLLNGEIASSGLMVDPDIHEASGTITGISSDNFSYQQIFDSSLVGIAKGLIGTVNRLDASDESEVIINGGKLAHSDKVRQAFKMVTDREIKISAVKDEALIGLYRLEDRRINR